MAGAAAAAEAASRRSASATAGRTATGAAGEESWARDMIDPSVMMRGDPAREGRWSGSVLRGPLERGGADVPVGRVREQASAGISAVAACSAWTSGQRHIRQHMRARPGIIMPACPIASKEVRVRVVSVMRASKAAAGECVNS
ncbi:hypothetical protein GCM10025877_19360 [Agromyces mangrovi Wang et al. 2018]|nr:hypothetical protein GCM10025877_19360 [Agromyces mangrovi]